MYSQLCNKTCFEDRSFAKMINILWQNNLEIISVSRCTISPWATQCEHRNLHPAEPSPLRIQKTDSHTPQTFTTYPSSPPVLRATPIHLWWYNFPSEFTSPFSHHFTKTHSCSLFWLALPQANLRSFSRESAIFIEGYLYILWGFFCVISKNTMMFWDIHVQ